MLIVVKRTESELHDRFGGSAAFATGALRYDDDPLQLESYQRAFLDDRSTFRWVVKARQVGFSFLFAIECLVRCHLQPNFTAICVSYNHADAVEKVRVARQLYEELPAPYRKRLVTDTRTELEFETNSGTRRGRSRIVSVPSKPPRGKHGTVYLDELAHYQDARKVYAGTTAAIARSKGQLTAASTPLGRRGLFWEICSEELRAYPSLARQAVPWWACTFFCRDVPRAVREAPLMSTEERVERFGTEALRHQFESLDLLEFQQEFELSFIAERLSYYPYDLILGCTLGELELAEDWSQVPVPTGRLVAGYDVGRRQHRSALALFEEREGRRFLCRALRTFEEVPFEEQKAELRGMLETLPIARFSIDGNGIGMNLAEDLGRDFPQVVTESSSGPAKERWATDFKILAQRKAVELPRERGLVAEIHSVERRVNPSGRVSFDSPATSKGHADRFWAIAMACQKERQDGDDRVPTVRAYVIGSDRSTSDDRVQKLVEWSQGRDEAPLEAEEADVPPARPVRRPVRPLPPQGHVRRGRPEGV